MLGYELRHIRKVLPSGPRRPASLWHLSIPAPCAKPGLRGECHRLSRPSNLSPTNKTWATRCVSSFSRAIRGGMTEFSREAKRTSSALNAFLIEPPLCSHRREWRGSLGSQLLTFPHPSVHYYVFRIPCHDSTLDLALRTGFESRKPCGYVRHRDVIASSTGYNPLKPRARTVFSRSFHHPSHRRPLARIARHLRRPRSAGSIRGPSCCVGLRVACRTPSALPAGKTSLSPRRSSGLLPSDAGKTSETPRLAVLACRSVRPN